MSNRIVSLVLSGFLIIIFFNWSCTKLDTTTIGSDLLPAVDNINTFADTFAINTTQGVFNDDTTKLTVRNTSENYVFGLINDPIFGSTDARLTLQLKPSFYPFYIGNAGDTLVALDSVVLCFSLKAIYGDSVVPMVLQVNEVPGNVHNEWDSLGTYDKPFLHDVNYTPLIGDPLSGPTTINFPALSTYQHIGKGNDSVINQIRIRLTNQNFLNKIIDADTTLYGVYNRDTLYRALLNNGFSVSMVSGNALLYTQLSDPSTRLELHYKYKNGTATPLDTAMTTFVFNNGVNGTSAPRRGAVADHIVRTRNALPNPGDQEIYLQTAPGTFANLKIPQLTGYSNRIVHRAEIIMEQIPGDPTTDGFFTEPNYIYLDLVDSGTSKWKPIYYDLNPSYLYDPDFKSGLPFFPANNQVDFSYFGATPKKELDPTSPTGTRSVYSINITRYVQQICTKQTPNYEMRLFVPYNIIYPQYSDVRIAYPNLVAAGRVRLAGGNFTDPSRRMRLRIVYSKLK